MPRSAGGTDLEAISYPPGPRYGSDLKYIYIYIYENLPVNLHRTRKKTQNYAQKNKPLHPREYFQIYSANLQIKSRLGQI